VSEPTAPSFPAPPPPPPTAGRSPRLEVIAVSVVLLTAAVLSVVASFPGSSNGIPAADTGPAVSGVTGSPITSPSDALASPSTTTPEEPEPEPVAELVSFRRVDANLAPVGCEADLTFAWFPDRAADPLVGQEAVIRVTGPQVGGTYRETFTPDGFSLEFQVALGEASRWTAVARSLGGRPADPSFVVEASIDALPFC
jgi:hypothetical protein